MRTHVIGMIGGEGAKGIFRFPGRLQGTLPIADFAQVIR